MPEVSARGRLVRLLDEFLGGEDALEQALAAADIAIFGRRPIRRDTERYDMPALGRGARGAAGCDEARDVGDDVVGGQRQHDRRVAPPQRMHRAGDNRRSGVAPMRLEQDVGVDPDLGELLGDQEPVLMIGDDDGPSEHRSLADPADRLLKGRARTEQPQKLLGPPLARRRPQPRPGAAAHDEGNDRLGHRRSARLEVASA